MFFSNVRYVMKLKYFALYFSTIRSCKLKHLFPVWYFILMAFSWIWAFSKSKNNVKKTGKDLQCSSKSFDDSINAATVVQLNCMFFADMPHTLLITYLDIHLGKIKFWRGGKVFIWRQQVECPKQIRLLLSIVLESLHTNHHFFKRIMSQINSFHIISWERSKLFRPLRCTCTEKSIHT